MLAETTKTAVESVYRLHMIPKDYGMRYGRKQLRPIKAVIRVPTLISKEDLTKAFMEWKARAPKQTVCVSSPSRVKSYVLEDMYTFKIIDYLKPSIGESILVLSEKEWQRLLQWKP
ncbi:hypothetical protein HB847_15685 [Listeria booriae]|uniref:Uncharacterized protein n=1 Tax=Listeria booriae TaxID=1552123 RepID=A0A841YA36_9LIST|nr:hypothetical protein [Listeria booriae]MBC1373793.1 hypothetical protein [Listeria booriae]